MLLLLLLSLLLLLLLLLLLSSPEILIYTSDISSHIHNFSQKDFAEPHNENIFNLLQVYRLHLCTWNHVRQSFVESFQAVASTYTFVVGQVHVVDRCGMCHPIHGHAWWILDALQVPLLAFPHLINGLCKYTCIHSVLCSLCMLHNVDFVITFLCRSFILGVLKRLTPLSSSPAGPFSSSRIRWTSRKVSWAPSVTLRT